MNTQFARPTQGGGASLGVSPFRGSPIADVRTIFADTPFEGTPLGNLLSGGVFFEQDNGAGDGSGGDKDKDGAGGGEGGGDDKDKGGSGGGEGGGEGGGDDKDKGGSGGSGGGDKDKPKDDKGGSGGDKDKPKDKPADDKDKDKDKAKGDGKVTVDEAYIEKLRREAADARKAAKDLEAKNREYTDKELSDKERADKRAKEAEDKATEATAKLVAKTRADGIKEAVLELSPKYTEPVLNLITEAQVPHDEDGNPDPVKLKKRLEQIRKDYPELFKAGNGGNDAGAGNRGGGGNANSTNMNDIIRRGAGRGR